MDSKICLVIVTLTLPNIITCQYTKYVKRLTKKITNKYLNDRGPEKFKLWVLLKTWSIDKSAILKATEFSGK